MLSSDITNRIWVHPNYGHQSNFGLVAEEIFHKMGLTDKGLLVNLGFKETDFEGNISQELNDACFQKPH
jgi:hypothetical protein